MAVIHRSVATPSAPAESASEDANKITFWFGCNMLRHAELIRLTQILLERVGYDVATVGGAAYCCGTAHDHQPAAASGMAARTVERFNAAADAGRTGLVTWCPSCHMHMHDHMAPGNPTRFEVSHVTERLAARLDRLAALMTTPVARTVLLHRHTGLATHVAVNDHVAAILARVPGLRLVDGPLHPGHMCSALAAVPGALAKAAADTAEAATAAGCDTVATIFHSCHRELVSLERDGGPRVVNWVQLVATAMGLPAADAYKDWRNGAAPDVAAIERADPARYSKLVEPELRRPAIAGSRNA